MFDEKDISDMKSPRAECEDLSYLASPVAGRCEVIGEGRGAGREEDCAAVVWR